MKAEIISIGTELLLGEILDTNTRYLAGQLAAVGIDLYFTSSVGDNHERLNAVLKQAWERSDLILTTGGLGPTDDDITREAVARWLGEELAVDKSLEKDILKYFRRRGVEMPASNVRQANVIPSATAVGNPQGTAPGWWVEKEGRIIVTMPSPPGEMQFMWENAILPRLQRKTGAVILSRMIKTYGISEAAVGEMVASLASVANPSLATYAKKDGICLRIAARAAHREEAQGMIDRREAEVRELLGDHIWGVDEDTPEGLVGELLVDRGLTLAVGESFSGGLLASNLSDAPGNRAYFRGGIVAASDEAKLALGLDAGLVAGGAGKQTAAALAALARRKLNATVGIGIDGYVATEDGAAVAKVFTTIDTGQDIQQDTRSYPGRQYFMKRRAAYHALFRLMELLRQD
ncbi:CinA family nicotinamide mononucleotide deamidase-related protein [Chloroflexota bacterium]